MRRLQRTVRTIWEDSANRVLSIMAASAVGFLVVHLLALDHLPAEWRRPGSAPLHVLGLCGALLFVAAAGFSVAKRAGGSGGGGGGSPRGWFGLHVAFAWVGILFAAVHAAGRFLTPPALILALAVGLMGLGVWARVRLSADVAATFAAKRAGFGRHPPERKDLLLDVIRRKSALLSTLDPQADEAVWSPTPGDWLRHPVSTGRYASLAARERRLIGSRQSVPAVQGYWRLVHILASYALVLGLAAHVVVVTFFPEYAARGGEIDWWYAGDRLER